MILNNINICMHQILAENLLIDICKAQFIKELSMKKSPQNIMAILIFIGFKKIDGKKNLNYNLVLEY